jgi:hypothetical protein
MAKRKRCRCDGDVYVVHRYEKNEGSQIILVTRDKKRAEAMVNESSGYEYTSVDPMELEVEEA